MAHGAVEALLGALKAHIENAEICGSVARAVSFLAEGEDDHKQAFVHGGALPLLVEACKRHVGVPKACVALCRTIKVISTGSDARADAATMSGVFPVLVAVCSRNKEDPLVVEAACTALLRSTPESNEGIIPMQEELQEFLLVIMGVIKLHASDPIICSAAAWALWKLALARTNYKAQAVRAGIIPLLIEILNTHYDDPSVCAVVARGLRSISLDGAAFKRMVVEAGGLDALVAGLRGSQWVTDVASNISMTLRTVAMDSDAGRSRCFELMAHVVLVETMARHAGDAGVVERVSAALAGLARGNAKQKMALYEEANVLPPMVDALSRHSQSAGVCVAVTATLAEIQLGDRNTAIRKAVADSGLVPALALVARQHKGAKDNALIALRLSGYYLLPDGTPKRF